MKKTYLKLLCMVCILAIMLSCFSGCNNEGVSSSDSPPINNLSLNSVYDMPEGVKMNIIDIYKRDCKPTVTKDKIPGTDIDAIKIEAFQGGSLIFTGPAGKIGGVDWELGKYITVPFYSEETHASSLRFVFKEDPGSSAQTEFNVVFTPGFIVNHSIALDDFDLQNLFLSRLPGVLKCTSWGSPTDATKISYMEIQLPWSEEAYTIWLGEFTMTDTPIAATLPDSPIVDEMGQWKDKDWEGKTKNTDELITDLKKASEQEYNSPNADFDEYGGYSKIKLTATGYFHTQYSGDRWWLVDPIGNAFYSTGICVTVPTAPTIINQEIKGLYDWVPSSSDEKFKTAWDDSNLFSYTITNLIRAFGKDNYLEKWEKMTSGRMKSWGMNTVGNWSSEGFGTRNKMPYVTQMEFPTTGSKVFRDFPDVFSEMYQKNAKIAASSLKSIATDPYCIGYFLNNEPEWQFADGYIADYLFANPASLATKTVAINYLKKQYNNSISELNDAWDKEYKSFDDLTYSIKNVSQFTARSREDIVEISMMMIEEYIRVPSQAAKEVAPNHLNLGIRWGSSNTNDTLLAGTKYYDVFSYNHYATTPDIKRIQRITKLCNIPVLITEFHAGSLDSGLMSNGLIGCLTQEERGKYYSYYVENLAALPGVVGTHYFQYNDQPLLGRSDGENYQIGFVDVCNKPYEDFVVGVTNTNKNIYDICSGKTEPTRVKPIITVAE